MKPIKTILCLIIMVSLSTTANAVTVIDIPKTLSDTHYLKENLIDTELHTDESNSIIELKTTQYAMTTGNATLGFYFGNDTGNDTEYTVQVTRQKWIIFDYYVITARLISNNYTIFSINRTENGLDSSFTTWLKYDLESGNTTFSASKSEIGTRLEWNGRVNPMPAHTIRIRSDAPYKIDATVINIDEYLARQEKMGSLNPFLGWLAGVLKLILPSSVFEALLTILILINLFFTLGNIIISSIFYRPYLIIVWFLSFANIYVLFKTSTYSEFVAEYVKVIVYAIGGMVTLFMWVARLSVEFLKLVRQIFQI